MAGLADLSEDEFRKALAQGAAARRPEPEPFPIQPAQAAIFDAPDLAPLSTEALDQANAAISPFAASRLPFEPTAREGARLGIPLKLEADLPFTKQLALEVRRRPIDKFRELQRQYGAENVQMTPDGSNFVVRNQVNPDTGTPIDMVVPTGGINAATLVAALPEIVLGIVGARAGGAVGRAGAAKMGTGPMLSRLLTTFGSLFGMAIGGQTVGAIKDAAVRAFGGDPVEVDEIAKERAKDAGVDFAIGTALGAGIKVGSRFISPLVSGSAKLAEEQAAVAALEKLAGEPMPQTLGEMTGSKILQRGEAQFAKQPGSSAAFDVIQEKKDTFIRRLQNRFLGLSPETPPGEVGALLPGQQETGERALGALGSQALQLEGGVARAAQAVGEAGTAEVQALTGINIPSRINPSSLGDVLRRTVTRSFESFKGRAAQLYNDFLSKPEIGERIVPLDTLAAEAGAMKAKLPAAIVTKQEILPILDEFGQPLTTEKKALEQLDTFIAPKVRSVLDRLASLKQAETSISDLKQIRTSVDDAIAEGVSIPGTDVSQLRTIRDMINGSIREGLQGLPNGKALLAEWDNLNDFYRKGISRFDKTSIRQILVKPGEQGDIGRTALVERTFGNSAGAKDVYDEYAKFFGRGSVEFRSLQAAIAENAIGAGALKPGTEIIDGKTLLNNLNGMRREVAQDILGINEAELRRIGEALGAAQGKLDVNELSQLARSRSMTAEKLTELISTESERAAAYRNRLMNAARKGAIDPERIQPAEFVRYMTNKASEPEVVEVLGRLQGQPELLQSIRTLAAEEFLVNAGFGTKLKPSTIVKTMGDRARQDVWRAMLSDETYNALNQFAVALRPTEAATQLFSGSGNLAATKELFDLFARGELTAVPGILTRALASFIYAGPGKVLANRLVSPGDAHRFINGVIASEPFLNYLTDRFGTEQAEAAVTAFGDAMNKAYQRDMQVRGTMPLKPGQRLNLSNMSDDEFRAYMNRGKE